jgi:hypothetical protein
LSDARFATWLDLASGAVRNSYITPEKIGATTIAKFS